MPAQILPTIDNPVQDAAQFAQTMSNFAMTVARLKQTKLEAAMAQSSLDTQALQQQLLQANLERAKMENSEYQATLKDRVQTTVKTLQSTGGKADYDLAATKIQTDNLTKQAQQQIDFDTMKLADSFNRMLMNDPNYATLAQDELSIDQRISALQQQMVLIPEGEMRNKLESTLGDLLTQKTELATSRKAYALKAAKPYPSLTSIMAPKVEGELSPTTQPSEEGKIVTPQPTETPTPSFSSAPPASNPDVLSPIDMRTKALLSGAASPVSGTEGTPKWTSKDIIYDSSTGQAQVDLEAVARRLRGTSSYASKGSPIRESELQNAKKVVSNDLYNSLSKEFDRLKRLGKTPEELSKEFSSWKAYLGPNMTEDKWTKLQAKLDTFSNSLAGKFSRRTK